MTQQASLSPSAWRKLVSEGSRQDIADLRFFWQTNRRAITIMTAAVIVYAGIAVMCYVYVNEHLLILFAAVAQLALFVAMVVTATRRRMMPSRRRLPRPRV